MTDRELMQQALDALEDACGGRCNAENNPCWQRDIANALRGRVEQLKPLRPWVGLTDAELAEFSDEMLGSYDLCLEVEAYLQSKNT